MDLRKMFDFTYDSTEKNVLGTNILIPVTYNCAGADMVIGLSPEDGYAIDSTLLSEYRTTREAGYSMSAVDDHVTLLSSPPNAAFNCNCAVDGSIDSYTIGLGTTTPKRRSIGDTATVAQFFTDLFDDDSLRAPGGTVYDAAFKAKVIELLGPEADPGDNNYDGVFGFTFPGAGGAVTFYLEAGDIWGTSNINLAAATDDTEFKIAAFQTCVGTGFTTLADLAALCPFLNITGAAEAETADNTTSVTFNDTASWSDAAAATTHPILVSLGATSGKTEVNLAAEILAAVRADRSNLTVALGSTILIPVMPPRVTAIEIKATSCTIGFDDGLDVGDKTSIVLDAPRSYFEFNPEVMIDLMQAKLDDSENPLSSADAADLAVKVTRFNIAKADMTIRLVKLKVPLTTVADIVQQTDEYKDYRDAKSAQGDSNDFMELEAFPGRTYKTVQNAMNALTSYRMSNILLWKDESTAGLADVETPLITQIKESTITDWTLEAVLTDDVYSFILANAVLDPAVDKSISALTLMTLIVNLDIMPLFTNVTTPIDEVLAAAFEVEAITSVFDLVNISTLNDYYALTKELVSGANTKVSANSIDDYLVDGYPDLSRITGNSNLWGRILFMANSPGKSVAFFEGLTYLPPPQYVI